MISGWDLQEVHTFMRKYYWENKQNPTGMTIARAMGFTQTQVISRQKKLKKLGLLDYRKGKHPAYVLAGTEDV